MQLSIIIVSWNVKDHLRNCLKSIQAHTNGVSYEVIVVDNASHDGSVEMLKQEFPDVRVIANTENKGFGAACNQGAATATGEVLVFFNDDAFLKEDSFSLLYQRVMKDATIGVIAPHLVHQDGSHQDSVRRFPTWKDQAIILTKLHNFFPKLTAVKRYYAYDFDYAKEQEVDQLMGACMVMRKEVFDRADGFDEAFFVWFEEVDLQKRIKEQLGLRIVYTPETEITHAKGASFSQVMSLTSQRRLNRSMRYYFRKHHGMIQAALLTLLQPLSLLLALLVQLYRALGGNINALKHGQN